MTETTSLKRSPPPPGPNQSQLAGPKEKEVRPSDGVFFGVSRCVGFSHQLPLFYGFLLSCLTFSKVSTGCGLLFAGFRLCAIITNKFMCMISAMFSSPYQCFSANRAQWLTEHHTGSTLVSSIAGDHSSDDGSGLSPFLAHRDTL